MRRASKFTSPRTVPPPCVATNLLPYRLPSTCTRPLNAIPSGIRITLVTSRGSRGRINFRLCAVACKLRSARKRSGDVRLATKPSAVMLKILGNFNVRPERCIFCRFPLIFPLTTNGYRGHALASARGKALPIKSIRS